MIYSHMARKPRKMLAVNDSGAAQSEDDIISAARDILMRRMTRTSYDSLSSPQAVRGYLQLTLGTLEREEFWCIWLDAQHRVISADMAFAGTLTQTSVYPREVIKDSLAHNAAAVIFAHNHPSGVAEPSQADEILTCKLKEALAMVDVRVLDHFIVAGRATLSFAERGLL